MGFCEQCKKWISQPEGKKKKRFCDSTCRSNFWYAENKKGKSVFVKPPPETFDGPKLPDNFIGDEHLSFDKMRAEMTKPQIKRSFEEFQQLIVECETKEDYLPIKREIESSNYLTQKQKDHLLKKQ